MTATNDRAYYAERERRCLMLADQARSPDARASHLKLAALYARRAQETPEPDRDAAAFG